VEDTSKAERLETGKLNQLAKPKPPEEITTKMMSNAGGSAIASEEGRGPFKKKDKKGSRSLKTTSGKGKPKRVLHFRKRGKTGRERPNTHKPCRPTDVEKKKKKKKEKKQLKTGHEGSNDGESRNPKSGSPAT